MAKKSSASSRPVKLVRARAEDILSRPPTKRQKEALERVRNIPDSEIDFSDIPPLSEEQLASAFRRGAKELIAVRLDRDVLTWLKQFGTGYSIRINGILRTVMEHQRR